MGGAATATLTHTQIEASDIVKLDNDVWLMNRKGTLVGAFPIDYLAWTEDASAIAARVESSTDANSREIWLEGSASPEANKALTERGWMVKERVALLTGQSLQEQTAAGAGAGATGTAIGIIR